MTKKTAAVPAAGTPANPAAAAVTEATAAAPVPAGPTKEEKAAAKAAKAAEAKVAREAAKGPEQNGIRRPKAGTVIGNVWAILDAASAKKQAPAALADVKEDAKDINGATLRTQYARWRKFNGVAGRVAKPAAPAATEGQAAV